MSISGINQKSDTSYINPQDMQKMGMDQMNELKAGDSKGKTSRSELKKDPAFSVDELSSKQMFDGFYDKIGDQVKPGNYLLQADANGNVSVEEMEEEGEPDKIAEGDHKKTEAKHKPSEDDEVKEKKEKSDDTEWMIMECTPDPEDPHNRSKAKYRVVAQGKGKVPG